MLQIVNGVWTGILSTFSVLSKAMPFILFAIAVLSGAMLFLPSGIIQAIGMNDFIKTNRSYIALTFLASAAFLISHLFFSGLIGVMGRIRKRNEAQILLKDKHQLLQYLTPDEKRYLRPYIFNDKTSQDFPIKDEIADNLVKKGIILKATDMDTSYTTGFPYSLKPWAREYLSKNRKLLS